MDIVKVVTPALTLSEMDSVNTLAVQLGKDIGISPAAPANVKQAYLDVYQEWQRFYSDYTGGPAAWAARGLTSVYNKVLEYRDRFNVWIVKFRGMGGITTADALPPKSGGFSMGPVLFVGAVAAGAWWLLRGRGEDDD